MKGETRADSVFAGPTPVCLVAFPCPSLLTSHFRGAAWVLLEVRTQESSITHLLRRQNGFVGVELLMLYACISSRSDETRG